MTDRTELWRAAKPLLLPYEGMMSQIYVLDLPLFGLETVLDTFVGAVSGLEVVTFGESPDTPQLNVAELAKKLLTTPESRDCHILEGDWDHGRSLSMWLWPNSVNQSFDAEIVFSAGELFPEPTNEAACLKTFSECIDLVETFRSINPGSECVLSASEVGDPRDDRDKPWTLFW